MSNQKVHILLPVYNWEKYILEQIFSLHYQTYTNWTLYIVNDWSKDNSMKIVDDFISHYWLQDKIYIMHNENNIWLSKSIEIWLRKIATYIEEWDFVAYCDADDVWCKNKLDVQVQFMIDNIDCDLCYHDLAITDQYGVIKHMSFIKRLHRIDNNIYNNNFSEFCTGQHIPSITMLFRANHINDLFPFPPEFPQDYWTWLVFSYLKKNISYINKPLGYYRRHEKSMSCIWNNLVQEFSKLEKALRILYEKYKDPVILYYQKYAISRKNREQKKYTKFLQALFIMVQYPKIFLLFVYKIYIYILYK